MSTEQMRAAIAEVYSGPRWKRKVANMFDDQVVAVYYKFQREGRFNPNFKPPEKTRRPKLTEIKGDRDFDKAVEDARPKVEQLTFDDILARR